MDSNIVFDCKLVLKKSLQLKNNMLYVTVRDVRDLRAINVSSL